MSGSAHRPQPTERLLFLASTVRAEARLLGGTAARLFAEPMTTERAGELAADDALAERVDAFVARFGRLQDTLADKLLPAMLDWLSETPGTAIDNLARAERLGWIASLDDWLDVRRQRKRMIHEYVRDPAELTPARVDLPNTLRSVGPCSVCALAKAAQRNGSNVHTDVRPLEELGLNSRSCSTGPWTGSRHAWRRSGKGNRVRDLT
ncbi:MAG: hypothetical protein MUF08_08390 [Burkholderiaceae bacterium]|nr:hypothetical protein [Burkholderiaceae bacterium]